MLRLVQPSHVKRHHDQLERRLKELVAGYWILQVKSKEEAIEWIKRCPNPHNEEGEMEIRQIFEPGGLPHQ